MKILHVIPTLDPRGGGPMECLIQIASVHSRLGLGVEVVCFDEQKSPNFIGLPFIAHGLGKGLTNYNFHTDLVPWLHANYHRFDVAVLHGLWSYHGYAAWRVFKKLDFPYLVYTHGMLDPWFKHSYPLKHLKKWLFWPWSDYRVLRDAKAVLFTCEEERILASQSFWLYKANERVVKFGSATPPQDTPRLRSFFFESYPHLKGKRLLLFLSRIHEKKGCDILINAFAGVASNYQDVHLVMAGPDQTGLKDILVKQATDLGVSDRVTWTGMIQGDLKWGAFYAAELFVLPSHQENFGIAVAEALGCGLPVLISDKVNIWREIKEDGAGLIGNDDLEDTTKNLRLWLDMSISERKAMAAQARETFENRYTVEQMANSLISTIEEFVQ